MLNGKHEATMALPDWYVDQLREEIEQMKGLLKPHETGNFQIDAPFSDRIKARIGTLRRSIADLRLMVDTRDT
jgi:hypothetical protein